jgi:hypothetical protein
MPPLKFDPEATVEEIAGIGRHPRFDAVIDDERLYTSFRFLFLGCSLAYDRTIQTFTKVAQDVGADSLPHHYAILPCPTDAARRSKLEQRLADAHSAPSGIPKASTPMSRKSWNY